MGNAEEVHAWIGRPKSRPAIFLDSPGIISWKFSGNRFGSLEVVNSPELVLDTQHYAQDDRIEITGTKGVIWITRGHGKMMDVPPVVLYRDRQTRTFSDMPVGWEHSFINSTRHFIDAYFKGEPPSLTGEQGRDILRFALAAQESARTGSPSSCDQKRGCRMKLTGSEIVVEMLIREGVPYAIGIPGHGNLPLVDALRRRQDSIQVIMPRHEQAAVHMADGYFRVNGQPLAVYTSIGAGATNTAIGLATAYVDSIPLLLLIGETHTYMRGVGVLQEIDRQAWSDLPQMLFPAVKRAWRIDPAVQLPRAVSQAFNAMCTGRPGPALITLPMDVQADGRAYADLPGPARAPPA